MVITAIVSGFGVIITAIVSGCGVMNRAVACYLCEPGPNKVYQQCPNSFSFLPWVLGGRKRNETRGIKRNNGACM